MPACLHPPASYEPSQPGLTHLLRALTHQEGAGINMGPHLRGRAPLSVFDVLCLGKPPQEGSIQRAAQGTLQNAPACTPGQASTQGALSPCKTGGETVLSLPQAPPQHPLLDWQLYMLCSRSGIGQTRLHFMYGGRKGAQSCTALCNSLPRGCRCKRLSTASSVRPTANCASSTKFCPPCATKFDTLPTLHTPPRGRRTHLSAAVSARSTASCVDSCSSATESSRNCALSFRQDSNRPCRRRCMHARAHAHHILRTQRHNISG